MSLIRNHVLKFSAALLLACFALLPSPLLRAADPPAEAPVDSPVIGIFSVSSLTDIQAMIKGWGVPPAGVPPLLTADGITQMMPVLDPGSVDSDKQAGAGFTSHPEFAFPNPRAMFIAVPVKANTNTHASMIAQGGQAVPKYDELVALNGRYFRRMKDYVVLGMEPQVLMGIQESQLSAVHAEFSGGKKSPATFRAGINLGALRKAMGPEKFRAMIDQMDTTPPKNAEEKVGSDLVFDFVAGLDDAEFGVNRSGTDTHLLVTLGPVHVATAGTFSKPQFPDAACVRVDVATSILEQAPAIGDWYAKNLAPASKLSPAEVVEVGKVARKWTAAFLGGDAVTVGLVDRGGKPVVYIVQQHNQPIDLLAEMQSLVDTTNKSKGVMTTGGVESKLALTQLKSSTGQPIIQLDLTTGNTTQFTTLAMRSDKNVYLVCGKQIGPKDVEALTAAPAAGKMTGLVCGAVDLRQAKDLMTKLPASVLNNIAPDPDQRAQIMDLCTHLAMQFTADKHGKGMVIDMSVPDSLIKNMVNLDADANAQPETPTKN